VSGKRERAGQLVREWVLDGIRTGSLQPGAQIPTEPQLCALLGVGRSSVREAIQGLVAANVLRIRRGQGTFVQALEPEAALEAAGLPRLLSPHGILDLLEFRETVETGVVALACLRATPTDLHALRRALETNRHAVERGQSAVEADEQFHHALAEAAHNPVFLRALQSLDPLFRLSRETTNRVHGANERAYRSHVAIYDAIAARDPESARRAMLQHLDVLRQEVVQQAREIVAAAERRDGRGLSTTWLPAAERRGGSA
jgi:GntR family transcriptional repressor for pyruvate dehydrogenase complex